MSVYPRWGFIIFPGTNMVQSKPMSNRGRHQVSDQVKSQVSLLFHQVGNRVENIAWAQVSRQTVIPVKSQVWLRACPLLVGLGVNGYEL